MITMKQVEIGGFKVDDVPFLGFDLPQVSCFDVVLGYNLFVRSGSRIEFDYSTSKIRIVQKSPTEQGIP